MLKTDQTIQSATLEVKEDEVIEITDDPDE